MSYTRSQQEIYDIPGLSYFNRNSEDLMLQSGAGQSKTTGWCSPRGWWREAPPPSMGPRRPSMLKRAQPALRDPAGWGKTRSQQPGLTCSFPLTESQRARKPIPGVPAGESLGHRERGRGAEMFLEEQREDTSLLWKGRPGPSWKPARSHSFHLGTPLTSGKFPISRGGPSAARVTARSHDEAFDRGQQPAPLTAKSWCKTCPDCSPWPCVQWKLKFGVYICGSQPRMLAPTPHQAISGDIFHCHSLEEEITLVSSG